uniref:Target of Nesh-SH3-like n=1 Tax=Crassostrea virginica TaxID=6565 RepID=A0A8B8AP20_CRAVI|nr:target of Nesh-SH3-like [Crassostrea virginica]
MTDYMSATPPCWYSYNVWLDNSFNGCSGGQIFVKRTNYTSAPFLAVQFCNSTRYKLFLGSSLGGKFMNIGDGSGRGEDHCELVGGSELTASTGFTSSFQSVNGYYRDHFGQQFIITYSSAFPHYYECEVSIPGTDIVV